MQAIYDAVHGESDEVKYRVVTRWFNKRRGLEVKKNG